MSEEIPKWKRYPVISLGQRCHTNLISRMMSPSPEALPFDNIISDWQGIIDCFQNDFKNFFPKKIIKETYLCDDKNDIYADENGLRNLYRGKYFGFPHHELDDPEVIDAFKRRIERLDNILNTNKRVVFVRSILEYSDIALYNLFKDAINTKYPDLEFKVIYIVQNKHLKKGIAQIDDYIVAIDPFHILDEDAPTQNERYNFIINALKRIDIFTDKMRQLPRLVPALQNDRFRGNTINGIYPFLPDN